MLFRRSTCPRPAALPDAMLRRKHPTISVLANLLRLAEPRSVRGSQRDSVPEPRVARHELPWVIVRPTSPTAPRLRPIHSRPRAPDLSHNAVGVDSISERAPKVGVARQPWAGGPNPFGIVRSAGLRRLRPAALRMVQECCGSETRAPVRVSRCALSRFAPSF